MSIFREMTPQEFTDLLARYRLGTTTPEETELVENWYDAIGNAKGLSPEESAVHREATLVRLRSAAEAPPESRPRRTRYLWPAFAAAASLVLLFYFYTGNFGRDSAGKTHSRNASGKFYDNNGKSNRLIRLEDGSAVLLTPGSSLLCRTAASDSIRRVTLRGDAFFEIAKDSTRPFLVFCKKVTTRVLGTSFWVKSKNPGKAVEVTVHTGKVAVCDHCTGTEATNTAFSEKKNSFVTLVPNQQASFTVRKQASGEVASTPDQVSVLEVPLVSRSYRFNETPLPDVFKSLADQYALDIVLNSARINDCTFTGDLTGLPLLEKLDLICFSTGTRYHIDNTGLVIDSQGCR